MGIGTCGLSIDYFNTGYNPTDEITEGFFELSLDHPTGKGETRLGSALKTPCLWRKELINLPNWTPPASKGTPPPPPASD